MRWLALVLLVGCGDNLEGVTLEGRNHLEVVARCKQLTRCGLFPDEASCAAYARDRTDVPLSSAVAAGVVEFYPTVEQQCLTDLADVSCDQTSRSFRVRPLSCQGSFLGTRGAGHECRFDSECVTARCSEGICEPYECCQGTCKPARTVSGPCDDNADCFDTQYCNADHVCEALKQALAVCSSDAACEFGLACIGGTCRKLPPIGEACPYGRCADIGARCDANRMCVPIGLPEDPCSTDDDCSPFAQCNQQVGKCEAIPLLGMACTNRCAGNAACVNGTCDPPLEDGQPCRSSNECESGLCAEGPIFYACTTAPTCF